MSELESAVTGANIFDAFETDVDAEENGKWFEDIIGDGSGLNLKIRHMSSQAATKNLQRLMQANRKHMIKGKLPAEVDKRVLIEHLSEVILLDWAGVLDREGNAIAFSKENAFAVMTKLPKFRETVIRLAGNMENFKADAETEIVGN